MALQNHIHLDTSLGGAPENAPTNTWKAFARTPEFKILASFARSVTGKLQVQVLNSSGTPIQFKNFEYEIKAESKTDLETLASYQGKTVYFVDHYHADDGEDHTDDVRTMVMGPLGKIKVPAVNEPYYSVDITLYDNDTVT